jgi:hypothetical protein
MIGKPGKLEDETVLGFIHSILYGSIYAFGNNMAFIFLQMKFGLLLSKS